MKKFILKSAILLIPLWCIFGYYNFFVNPNITGDLGELGEIPFGKEYMEFLKKDVFVENYTIENANANNNFDYEIITVGDSFSDQGQEGYQNYLAHFLGTKILNIKIDEYDPEQRAVNLINSGFFKGNKIRYLIVESAERSFFTRLDKLDFNIVKNSEKKDILNINNKNDRNNLLTRTTAWLRLLLNYENPVIKYDLNTDLFSHEKFKNNLFIYNRDLNVLNLTSDEVEKRFRKLFQLKELCEKNNIQLIYILAATKYDLYRDYVIETPRVFNQNMLTYKKMDNYDFFVNTYNIFTPYITDGLKDIYKVNDTHWSPLGHKLVAEEIYRRMKLNKLQD